MSRAGRKLGHEPEAIRARGLAWFAAGLAATVVILYLGVGLLIHTFNIFASNRQAPSQEPWPGNDFASSEHWLQVGQDLAAIREQERQRLTTSAWIDKDHGIARIPIDRAMQLLAQQQRSKGP